MLKNYAQIDNQNRKNSDILNVVQIKPGINVQKDNSKDVLLTEFGKATLTDRYLLPNEDYQGMFARVASYFSAGCKTNWYCYVSIINGKLFFFCFSF